MSDLSNEPVVQKPVVSDDGNNQENKPENVPYSKFRELLDEKKKEQSEKRELASKVAEFEKREREKEEELLRKKGDYEALLKSRDEELAKTKQELSAREKRDLELAKARAFVKAAGGDIDSRFLEHGLINIDAIVVDPSTGEIDQMSVAQAVDSFKKVWPEAFKKPGMIIPVEAPNGHPSTIRHSDWVKLSAKDMKKYKPDQIIS